jgi:hypothetical protein
MRATPKPMGMAKSREWLDNKIAGAAPVGLPWPTLLAFLRIGDQSKSIPQAPHHGGGLAAGIDLARFPGLTWLNPLAA